MKILDPPLNYPARGHGVWRWCRGNKDNTHMILYPYLCKIGNQNLMYTSLIGLMREDQPGPTTYTNTRDYLFLGKNITHNIPYPICTQSRIRNLKYHVAGKVNAPSDTSMHLSKYSSIHLTSMKFNLEMFHLYGLTNLYTT